MGIGTSKKTGQQAEEEEAKKDNQEPCIRGGSFCMHTIHGQIHIFMLTVLFEFVSFLNSPTHVPVAGQYYHH